MGTRGTGLLALTWDTATPGVTKYRALSTSESSRTARLPQNPGNSEDTAALGEAPLLPLRHSQVLCTNANQTPD